MGLEPMLHGNRARELAANAYVPRLFALLDDPQDILGSREIHVPNIGKVRISRTSQSARIQLAEYSMEFIHQRDGTWRIDQRGAGSIQLDELLRATEDAARLEQLNGKFSPRGE